MTSPSKLAARYLQAIDDTRLPLQPLRNQGNSFSNKTNFGDKLHQDRHTTPAQDLDVLAQHLQLSSPGKTDLLRSKFETSSATVSSFKSPLNKSSTNSNGSATPSKHSGNSFSRNVPSLSLEEPEWANKNYKDLLSSPTRTSPRRPNTTATPRAQNGAASPSKLLPLNLDTPVQHTPKSRSSPYFSSPGNSTSTDSPGYEYLCRIEAIKNWLQIVLKEDIEHTAEELITSIRNGILLAKLANVILPSKRAVFLNDSKLQFRHTENINRFFQLLDYLNVPDLFRFELTDLYDAKNVPKVWFCLHALSFMLVKMDSLFPSLQNLVDTLEFSEDDIRKANRSLVGVGLPKFESADNGVPVPAAQQSNSSGAFESIKLSNNGGEGKNNYAANSLKSDPFNDSSRNHGLTGGTRLFQKEIENQQTKSKISTQNTILDSSRVDNSRYAKYRGELENYELQIIKLQSLSRGANFRYKMFVDKIILRSFSEEFNEFMAVCRGNLSRAKTVHRHRGAVNVYKDKIIELQAISRGFLLKNRMDKAQNISINSTIQLQNLIRGKSVRAQINKQKFQLLLREHAIVDFQAQIRMKLVHNKVTVILENRFWMEPLMIGFQSMCRTQIYKRSEHKNTISKGSYGLVELQSLLRGVLVRNKMRKDLFKIHKASGCLKELQSIARGGISRTRLCNSVLVNLLYEHEVLNDLFAVFRGKSLRKEVQRKLNLLSKYEKSSILPVQTMFRGIYVRSNREFLLEDVYDNVSSIIKFQSILRGRLARKEIEDVDGYYKNNMEKVIQAQAFIRTRLLQNNYNSLINLKSPPLSVIQKFAYLLTDKDIDYQELMELSDMKDRIVDISKHNESLENQIESLDIKLSLLDKNKITLDEFIKNKKIQKSSRLSTSITMNNFGKLNKSSRRKIELYESIFYLLQSKPAYFARLFNSMDVNSKGSKLCKDLQTYVVQLFPIKEASVKRHGREEYFFLKFIFSLMEVDIQSNCTKISEITKVQNCFWIDYFLHLNNHTYQRQHLKSMLGNLIHRVIESDELNFELDPSVIYESLIDREIEIHGSSDKPRNISAQNAIRQPDVSAKFVENLMCLRETATDLLNLLDKVVDETPLHVKLVCKQAYSLSQLHFPDRSHEQHLAVAGVIFMKHYIAMILQCPENFGFFIKDPFNPTLFNSKSRDNLKHLSRVLLQVFSMKPFSDNYLKPLNDYVSSSMEMTQNIISKLLRVNEIESEMKLNDYDDIITHERPQLTINANSLILLERIVSQHIDIMAPGADDQLYGYVNQAVNIMNSASDIVSLSEMGIITLSLNPATKEESLADSKSRTLFTQVKRCILYIIRIQNGDDLLELLVSAIQPKDEAKFRAIVSEEKKEAEESRGTTQKRPYYRTSLGDLSSLTYHDLKKMALQKLLKLESMNLITRKDSFQTILNEIAIDIKTKDSQRNSRKLELKIAADAVSKLYEKERFLQKQLADYNKHVELLLSQIQLVPKEKKLFSIIPVFSKQYFYHRELRKQNRLPKFGAYKYPAKKLLEQKVLLDIGGLINRAYSSSSKLDFMFSCHEVGKFTIEAATGAVAISGALKVLTLDDLLNLQYEKQLKLDLFDGMVIFDSENLIGLIFRKFYETKKE